MTSPETQGNKGGQEKPKAFEGTILEYIQKVSFDGQLYAVEVNDSVGKVIATGAHIQDNVCTFSNSVGIELYSRKCMPPAAECFELAFKQQQIDDERDPVIQIYARNFINALAAHIYSLANLPSEDERIQNVRWFNTKLEIYNQAVAVIDLYNDHETGKTVRETYKHLYYQLKNRQNPSVPS